MDREEIIVSERPDNISWEEISSVLKRAHEDNIKKGIVLPYPQLPPEEIKAKTEDRGGKMFVALCEGKVVATGAVAIIEKNLWCGNGRYAYCFLDAVLPEFTGRGIYRRIVTAQESFAESMGVARMLFDTDERNKRMLDISRKNGYRFVQYRIREGRNSVLMVKWMDGCPYSRLKCAWTFFRIKRNKKKLI
jgi:GNAT superfamily N-acetyltransferase